MKSISNILEPIQQEWLHYNQAFESSVHEQDNQLLNIVWQYISSKRGKQLRPMLTLLSAAATNGITDKTIDTAVAMEMLHNASLVHDDVVDASPTRRGNPSVSERWTNKVAVLTGDYMLSKTIGQTAKINNRRILQIVADLGAALANGELLQLHEGESMWITRERYLSIIREKTAVLFAACTQAGAISTGASERHEKALYRYGLNLGMCFQIQDDILDYSEASTGADTELGKPTMSDIRDGKVTLPLLIALERAPHAEADAIRALCENSEAIQKAESIEELSSFVLRYDGIGAARKIAQEYLDEARKALDCLHPTPYRDSLIGVLELTINRSK